VTIVIGTLIGFLLGITGAGGSVFAVPLLIFGLNIPVETAVACSLGAVAVSALLGGISHWRAGSVLWMPALTISLAGMLTAPLGKWLNGIFPSTLVLTGFALLATLIAVRMWRTASHATVLKNMWPSSEEAQDTDLSCRFNPGGKMEFKPRCLMAMSAGGLLVGLLSGLFGVGSGFLIVPLLQYQTGVAMRVASGTSLVSIALISSVGFASYALEPGVLNMNLLLSLTLSAAIGVFLGITLTRHLNSAILQRSFAMIMVILAVSIVIVIGKWPHLVNPGENYVTSTTI
jgi:uncharacterized protein